MLKVSRTTSEWLCRLGATGLDHVFYFFSCVETWSRARSGGHPGIRPDAAAGEEVQQRDRLHQAVVAARPGDPLHHALLLQEGDPLHGPGPRAGPKRAGQRARLGPLQLLCRRDRRQQQARPLRGAR